MDESTIPARALGALSARCPPASCPEHPQLTYGKAQAGVGADQPVNVGGQRDLEGREEGEGSGRWDTGNGIMEWVGLKGP